jgi:cytochrome c oxidase subunit 2
LSIVYGSRDSQSGTITLTARTVEHGGWSQRTIRVEVGKPVRIRLTSDDVTHGFLLPEFGIDTGPISPGEFTMVEFTPLKPGVYRFYCNILCSHHHGAMNGQIVVEGDATGAVRPMGPVVSYPQAAQGLQ